MFFPVASNLDPARPKTEESPTFLNILNKEANNRFFNNKNTRITRARVICSTYCVCTAIGVQILAYLSIQQMISPVRARALALSTPGWTRFGHDPSRGRAFFYERAGAWGSAGGRV